ncbi:MAG: hypothetical protein IKI31_05720 [Treponema sp.]|nr:hypothetical protein [Treponema sp.]
MSERGSLSWQDEKEVVKSNASVKLLITLIAHLPNFVVNILIFPVGFFFFIFSKRARAECARYQNQFIEYTKTHATQTVAKNDDEKSQIIKKPNALKQIISFSLCILEKIQGWSKKIPLSHITFFDDVENLIAHLETGKGAFLIGSHLGNTELLRSLAAVKKTGVERDVDVTVIMEEGATQNFAKTIQDMFPGSKMNVIDAAKIGPETIMFLEERLQKGGMIVATGDRTSAHSQNRVLQNNFLGKNALFPYGVFLLAYLLKAPVYFFFALRKKDVTLFPKYNMYVNKARTNFENVTRANKEEKIISLCNEFVDYLQKYCLEYPFQWYNFYDFWKV